MTSRNSLEHITWIDLESPSNEEVAAIAEEFALHPLVARELLHPSDRARVDLYGDSIYLILHFPSVGPARGDETRQEIDFVVRRNVLITAHYATIDPLLSFEKAFEARTLLGGPALGDHAGILFYALMRHLYEAYGRGIHYVDQELKRVEAKIFAGKEREMVEELSRISRTIIEYRMAIKSHREVLQSFVHAGRAVFGNDFSFYLESLEGEFLKLWNGLEVSKELATDLRLTTESVLNTKMNETMIHLTMMAFVTFPLSLIASIFSMNSDSTPIVGHPYDFWIIFAIMMASTFAIFGFFKYRRWL